jgi:uncharacterized protein YggE
MLKYFHRKLFCSLIFTSLLATAPLAAVNHRDPPGGPHGKMPRLAVTGTATLYKPADQVSLNVSITTQAKEAGDALSQNSAEMKSMIANIKSAGVESNELRTGQFRIHPTYTPRPKVPPVNWQATINGYQVTNTLSIQTEKVDLIGEVIDVATSSGATSVDSLQFSLKDPRQYRGEVITLAVKNAKMDAHALAEAAGQDLLRITMINLDNAASGRSIQAEGMLYAARSSVAPPIEGGDIAVSAHVTLLYEIGAE